MDSEPELPEKLWHEPCGNENISGTLLGGRRYNPGTQGDPCREKEALLQSIAELQKAVAFIDWKQGFYDDVLSGKTEYYSNLVPELMK